MAVGRYAPSPSGDLHVGNLRTAMLAWLFAHGDGAELRLRIDDLDPQMHGSPHESRQLEDLDAIGVRFQGPVLRQSERAHVYEAAITRLVDADLTYACFCSRREIREAATAPHTHLPDGAYPGTCRALTGAERARRAADRPAALRVRAEAVEVEFSDAVHGTATAIVDDFVIRRNDGVPSYNLATVVDDAEQGIGQVVRGDDLLTGTGRQIWLRDRLGLDAVGHAHVPLVVNTAGDRLAKRDGAITLGELADRGVHARLVRMQLARSIGLEAEPDTTLDDLLERFDPTRLPTDAHVWESPGDTQKNASDSE